MKRYSSRRFTKKQNHFRVYFLVAVFLLVILSLFLPRYYISDETSEFPLVRYLINHFRLSEFIKPNEVEFFANVRDSKNWNLNRLTNGNIKTEYSTLTRKNQLDTAAKLVKANVIFEESSTKNSFFMTQIIRHPRLVKYRLQAIPLLPGESFEVENLEHHIDNLFLLNALSTPDRLDGNPHVVLNGDSPKNHLIQPNGAILQIKDLASQNKIIIEWPKNSPGVLFVLGSSAEKIVPKNKIIVTIDELHASADLVLKNSIQKIRQYWSNESSTKTWPEYENSLQNLQFIYNYQQSNNSEFQSLFGQMSDQGYNPIAINIESAHPCSQTICSISDVFVRNNYVKNISESIDAIYEKNIYSLLPYISEKLLGKRDGNFLNINIKTRPNAVSYTWDTALSSSGSVLEWDLAAFKSTFLDKNQEKTREKELSYQIDNLLSHILDDFKDVPTDLYIYIKKLKDPSLKVTLREGEIYPGLLVTNTNQIANSVELGLEEFVLSEFNPDKKINTQENRELNVQLDNGDLWFYSDKSLAYLKEINFQGSPYGFQSPVIVPVALDYSRKLGKLQKWLTEKQKYSLYLKIKAGNAISEKIALTFLHLKAVPKCYSNRKEKFVDYADNKINFSFPAQIENDIMVICQIDDSENADLKIETLTKNALSFFQLGQYGVLPQVKENESFYFIKHSEFQKILFSETIPFREELSESKISIWTNQRIDWNLEDQFYPQFNSY